MGTGFAAPKTNWPPVLIKRNNGRRNVQRGSICAKGLRVSLPAYFAVVSPNLYATQPCANSCAVTAMINSPKDIKKDMKRAVTFNARPRFFVLGYPVLYSQEDGGSQICYAPNRNYWPAALFYTIPHSHSEYL